MRSQPLFTFLSEEEPAEMEKLSDGSLTTWGTCRLTVQSVLKTPGTRPERLLPWSCFPGLLVKFTPLSILGCPALLSSLSWYYFCLFSLSGTRLLWGCETTRCWRVCTWDDSAPVCQDHLPALHQGFEDAGDVGWSFVSFVYHQNVTQLHCLHLHGQTHTHAQVIKGVSLILTDLLYLS